jgi:hypothetical protein
MIYWIDKWLDKQKFSLPEVKEVPVGLSDSQVKSLAKHLKDDCTRGEKMLMSGLVSKWLKTQAFAQLQSPVPNWDYAPKEAMLARTWLEWLDKDFNSIKNREVLAQVERPIPPAPKVEVEVGQIWISGATRVSIIAKNDDDIVFQNQLHNGFDVYSIEDFTAKFERVGGSE